MHMACKVNDKNVCVFLVFFWVGVGVGCGGIAFGDILFTECDTGLEYMQMVMFHVKYDISL